MANSPIDEKILGRLARETSSSNALLSASLYQVLGLSILLSRKVIKARRLRKLDTSRDTKSLQLYHHIIWLAREGLSITEHYILPYCEDGGQGSECQVMTAKLRASFYHIFALFHNHPPISQLSAQPVSGSSPANILLPKANNGQTRRSPRDGAEQNEGQRRAGKAPLRDPIPSITSDASYITNPYAAANSQTPPPALPITSTSIPSDARRTPTRPPGLTPINIPATQAAASFLVPPLNYLPMARDQFDTAQHLANSLLYPAHALRLSISLEHVAFLRDCCKENDRARRLASRTVKEVYASSEGPNDDEFADAAALVQTLAGLVKKLSKESIPRDSRGSLTESNRPSVPANSTQAFNMVSPIDRTISVSPKRKRPKADSPDQLRPILRTPERLATVPEVDSTENNDEGSNNEGISPPVSRLSSRSRKRRGSSTPSDSAIRMGDVEPADEVYRHKSPSASNATSSRNGQPRASDGYVAKQERRLRDSNG